MNLIVRLLWVAIAGRFGARIPPVGPCRTPFRVLPTDLDVFMHVNNGVYLSLMDLARVDHMSRAGLTGRFRQRGWYPVVVAQTIQYRRSLKLFERFEIVTRVISWDEKSILVEQIFVRRGEAVAHALVRSRVLSASGSVPMSEVMALAENPAMPVDVPEYAARWNADQATWRGA